METPDTVQSPRYNLPDTDEDKPLTYSQRFKEECSQAAGLCLWDKIVESFKVKGKDGTDGSRSSQGNSMEMQEQLQQQQQALDEQKQMYEERLRKQQEEFEEKLQEQNEELQQVTEESNTKIKMLEEQLQLTKKSFQDQKFLMDLTQQYEFIVPNYRQLREEKKSFTIPPFYTHPGGYKFYLEVFPAGMGTGSGTNVSIRVWSHNGEYDSQLTFPAKIHITLQLLNQHSKVKGHYIKHISCIMKESSQGTFIGADQQFIGLGELEWNERKETHFLKENRLWFRLIDATVNTLAHE